MSIAKTSRWAGGALVLAATLAWLALWLGGAGDSGAVDDGTAGAEAGETAPVAFVRPEIDLPAAAGLPEPVSLMPAVPEVLEAEDHGQAVSVLFVEVRDDVTGSPVAGALVSLDDESGIETSPSGRRALLGELPIGREITVAAGGYAVARAVVPADVGRELVVRLERVTTLFVNLDVGDLHRKTLRLEFSADEPPLLVQALDGTQDDLDAAAWFKRSGGGYRGVVPPGFGGVVTLRGVRPGVPLHLDVSLDPNAGPEFEVSYVAGAVVPPEREPDPDAEPGPILESLDVVLEEGEWKRVTVGRKAFPEVTFQLRDKEGLPVWGAGLFLTPHGPPIPTGLGVNQMSSDKEGLMVARLPAGLYDVMALSMDRTSASRKNIEFKGTTHVDLELGVSEPVVVRLVWPGGGDPAVIEPLVANGPGHFNTPGVRSPDRPDEWTFTGLGDAAFSIWAPIDDGNWRHEIAAGERLVIIELPELGQLDVTAHFADALARGAPEGEQMFEVELGQVDGSTRREFTRWIREASKEGTETLTFPALRTGEWTVRLIERVILEEERYRNGMRTVLDERTVYIPSAATAELVLGTPR